MAVDTVLGPVDVQALGVTLSHEHVRVKGEPESVQFPHLFDDELARSTVIERLEVVAAAGVRTICDPTVLGRGRDVRFVRSVAEATGLNILVATGIYTLDVLPRFFAGRPDAVMVDAMVRDVEVGIQGTDIKAAFLKVATEAGGLTPDVERALRATARAHLATGVPIMTHSSPTNRIGLLQQDVLASEGVDLSRVIIGHCGDTQDVDYLRSVADRGSFLGMDRFTLESILANEPRLDTVVRMAEAGYADRMMLSQDASCDIDVITPIRPMTYVLDEVLPELERRGVSQQERDLMMIHNVKRWLDPSVAAVNPGDTTHLSDSPRAV
ncbi:phosphotriesterase family protein [Granulicoccus phenolivorans]|uniref:phosphotriesterase family protein n=1 Tax=Granulicoccus phenolivorans TaxID=266854 RepID=UPI00040EFBCE|nr:hypothetical protein [Granulicoccus phenolivorans]